jgi:class 3 adenylate cyclase
MVAGIVGDSKFQYDIWGDTVNTASQTESAGAVGEVNISEATFNLLKDEPGLSFSPRGRVAVKSKGEMAMFFARRKDGTAHTGE